MQGYFTSGETSASHVLLYTKRLHFCYFLFIFQLTCRKALLCLIRHWHVVSLQSTLVLVPASQFVGSPSKGEERGNLRSLEEGEIELFFSFGPRQEAGELQNLPQLCPQLPPPGTLLPPIKVGHVMATVQGKQQGFTNHPHWLQAASSANYINSSLPDLHGKDQHSDSIKQNMS